jgi:tetratricopeptide (TPR) repeat protein
LGGKRTSNKFAFVLGSTTALVAILAHSVVDFNMHVPANAVFTVVLMALLASHSRFATERYWLTPGVPIKMLTTLALCAGIGLMSALAVRRVPENLALARAAVSPVFSPQQVAHLERAFAVEPKNPETAFGLGEALRIQSSEGAENYVELGEQALAWFEKAADLNPWNSDHYARAGAVLDWLDRSGESTAKFARAEELDPNGYFTVAFIGYHYVNTGNYAAAKPYFERSIRLEFEDNPMAKNYLQITKQRMLEAAGAQVLPSGPRP